MGPPNHFDAISNSLQYCRLGAHHTCILVQDSGSPERIQPGVATTIPNLRTVTM